MSLYEVVGNVVQQVMAGNMTGFKPYDNMALKFDSKTSTGSKRKSNGSKGKSSKKKKIAKVVTARGNKSKTLTKTKKKKKAPKSLKGDVRKLKKQVNELTKDQCFSYFDYRDIASAQITGTVNQCTYLNLVCWDRTRLEAAIDDLPFIDRGATPAVDSINMTTAGFKENFTHFDNLYVQMRMVNNFEIPSKFDVYHIRQKKPVNDTPIANLTDHDFDIGVADANTNVLVFPTDIRDWNKHYKILKHERVVLRAGDEFVMTATKKNLKYNPLDNDNNGVTYDEGSEFFLVRHEGSVAHDTTTSSNVGLGDGGADIVLKRKFMVKYQGDTAMRRIETTNTLSSITVAETAGPAVDMAVDGG